MAIAQSATRAETNHLNQRCIIKRASLIIKSWQHWSCLQVYCLVQSMVNSRATRARRNLSICSQHVVHWWQRHNKQLEKATSRRQKNAPPIETHAMIIVISKTSQFDESMVHWSESLENSDNLGSNVCQSTVCCSYSYHAARYAPAKPHSIHRSIAGTSKVRSTINS